MRILTGILPLLLRWILSQGALATLFLRGLALSLPLRSTLSVPLSLALTWLLSFLPLLPLLALLALLTLLTLLTLLLSFGALLPLSLLV